jgi:hypothetical protein
MVIIFFHIRFLQKVDNELNSYCKVTHKIHVYPYLNCHFIKIAPILTNGRNFILFLSKKIIVLLRIAAPWWVSVRLQPACY